MHPLPFRMICGLALASCLTSVVPADAEVLLDEQWSDGDHTNPPTPVWSGHPEDLSSRAGSLTTTISTNSMKVWTYFVDDGDEVSLTPGESLRVTMDLSFKGALYDQTSRGYRIGVYSDPTDPQVHANINSDGGGEENPWSDATGYAVELALSKGPQLSNPIQIFKRINNYRSLLGSSGAMDSVPSGGEPVALAVDQPYTLTFEVSCVSTTRVDLTCGLADQDGVVAQQTVLDDGFSFASGDLPRSDKPYVTFEHLFIRTNSREASADAIEYRSIKVERVTHP